MESNNGFKYKAYTPKSKGGGNRRRNKNAIQNNFINDDDKLSKSYNQRRSNVKSSHYFQNIDGWY